MSSLPKATRKSLTLFSAAVCSAFSRRQLKTATREPTSASTRLSVRAYAPKNSGSAEEVLMITPAPPISAWQTSCNPAPSTLPGMMKPSIRGRLEVVVGSSRVSEVNAAASNGASRASSDSSSIATENPDAAALAATTSRRAGIAGIPPHRARFGQRVRDAGRRYRPMERRANLFSPRNQDRGTPLLYGCVGT